MQPNNTLRLALATAAAFGLASAAMGQVSFSVDYRGATRSATPSFGPNPITEGDILIGCTGTPSMGPLGTPGIRYHGGNDLGLALYPTCVGLAPGTPCSVEVDAISYGNDFSLGNTFPLEAGMVWYSVEWIRTTGGFLMPSTELPRVVAQLSVPIGSGLAVVYCLLRLLDGLTGQSTAGGGSGPADGGEEK